MDAKNRFHTKETYWLMRLEHLGIAAACLVLTVLHAAEMNWWVYAVAFWLIDVVGYIPGAIWYRRRGGGRIPVFFHHVYNIAHTYLVLGTGLLIWAYLSGGLQWEMLGAVLHLSVDRGMFGNVFKPRELEFEPVAASNESVLQLLGRAEAAHRHSPSGPPSPDVAQVIEHPSGYLALSERNQFFTLEGIEGFIPYRERGKHLIAFGGVHAARQDWETLLDGFLAEAERRRRRVLAVQVRENQVQLFRRHGFTVNQFGTSYTLRLNGYSLKGSSKVKLRNKIRRAQNAGLRVVELGREIPNNEASFALLHEISAAWLAGKGKKELDFMIGELGTPADQRRRIFLVLNAQERPVAFITYVPVWGKRPGYLHDLTRKLPDAPVGAMELCNSEAINRLSQEGAEYLHFGFTPFITQGSEPAGASHIVSWVIDKLRKYGRAVYPAETQANYKMKWGVDVTEPEFFAARPLSLRAVLDTLVLTRSI